MDEKSNPHTRHAVLYALIAALLYGISVPVSKILLTEIPPTMMAALLYLGAGSGMMVVNGIRLLKGENKKEASMTKRELPFLIGMIALDIIAPILLMIGLTKSDAGSVSLLNNFEIVATAMIALVIFKESIGKRMWVAIGWITLASMILSVQDFGSFTFSTGSVLVLLATVSWGVENNVTRMLSLKDPMQIVVIKGFGSGFGSLAIALFLREYTTDFRYIMIALLLGCVAYGLSIYFYILAQRDLGAARTSAFYAAAPFIGVLASWILLRESPTRSFYVALVIMGIGAYYAVTEKHKHEHHHDRLTHEHKHSHKDGHHNHTHENGFTGEHSHSHTHEELDHEHQHVPDLHHRHKHK